MIALALKSVQGPNFEDFTLAENIEFIATFGQGGELPPDPRFSYYKRTSKQHD